MRRNEQFNVLHCIINVTVRPLLRKIITLIPKYCININKRIYNDKKKVFILVINGKRTLKVVNTL